MRVIQQINDITKHEPGNSSRNCFGCFPFRWKSRGSAPKTEPDSSSPVKIQRENAEEEFGVILTTYMYIKRRRRRKLCYRHILTKVEQNGPGGQMRLEDGDELLLINEEFVQNLEHESVLKLLSSVKIDGQSRFELLIRRLKCKRARKTWIWIKTSAVLAPDSHPHPIFDDHPVVEDVEYKRVAGNKTEIKTLQMYKVRGTQLYLEIQDGQVDAALCKGTDQDKRKIICKRQRYWQDGGGEVHFEAALSDVNEENYIAFGPEDEIMIQKEPLWFDQAERGSDILFRYKDCYLGYNLNTDEVDAMKSVFFFEEFPGEAEVLAALHTSSSTSTRPTSRDSEGSLIDNALGHGSVSDVIDSSASRRDLHKMLTHTRPDRCEVACFDKALEHGSISALNDKPDMRVASTNDTPSDKALKRGSLSSDIESSQSSISRSTEDRCINKALVCGETSLLKSGMFSSIVDSSSSIATFESDLHSRTFTDSVSSGYESYCFALDKNLDRPLYMYCARETAV